MPIAIKGLDGLNVALEAVEAAGREGARDGIAQALHDLAQEWSDRVPVLDGHYRRAMQQDNAVSVKDGRSGPYGYVRVPYVKGVPKREQPQLYALRLEYGDRARAAQPSARPALDAVKGSMGETVGHGIAARIGGHGGRGPRRQPGA